MLLLLFVAAITYGQVVTNFETATPVIYYAGPGAGTPSVVTTSTTSIQLVANPDTKGNPASTVAKLTRPNTSNWWHGILIPLNTDIDVPAGQSIYLHIMAHYPGAADMALRLSVAETAGVPGTGAGSLGQYRPISFHQDSNNWQDIVFAYTNSTAATTTITNFSLFYDAGFENGPAASGNYVLNSTTDFAYLDNIEFTTSAAPRILNTWNGVTSSDWSDATNWEIGVPTDVRAGEIPSGTSFDPIVTTNTSASVKELDVKAGATLTVESGGSLIASSATATTNITYKRTLTKDALIGNAWYTVSSPVSGVTAATLQGENNLAPGSAGSRIGLATYNNDTPGWSYFTTSSTDNIDPGVGLIAKLNNAAVGSTLSFTGTYTNGNVLVDLTQGSSNSYNFIGNPFTSYVNLGIFLNDNSVTDRLSELTVWIWNKDKNGTNMGGYEQKMAPLENAFEIAPGQGFFVQKGTLDPTQIFFRNTNQSHKTDSFLKFERTEIKLLAKDKDMTVSTKLCYIEGASTGFDNGYDGSIFEGIQSNFDMYTSLITNDLDKKLGTQSLPKENFDNMVVPVGLKVKEEKQISFSASTLNLPKGLNVYLEDRTNNVFTLLNKESADYIVNVKETDSGSGRFFIHTKTSVLSAENLVLDNISIHQNQDVLKLNGLKLAKGNFSLYNVLGKQVLKTSFNDVNNIDVNVSKLTKGIYIVRLQTEKGSLNKKIILE